MSTSSKQDQTTPEAGMLADHKSGTLDPRIVTRVEEQNGEQMIYIQLLTREAGPFPASNYVFHKETPPKEKQ